MKSIAQQISDKYKKSAVVDVRSGDSVRVHQKVREGSKERVQVFEGLVIRVSRDRSLTASFTVRRVASGVGVEKTYLIHSPNVLKVEVVRRSRVRRNYLTYMRELTGKSARLTSVDFDKETINAVKDEAAEAEEAKIHEEQAESYDPAQAAAEKAEAKAAKEAGADEAPKSDADKLEAKPAEKADAAAPAAEQNKDK